jgi:hypothetical protein
VSEPESSGKDRPISTEAVGTLIWLLDGRSLDRRRYSVLNRLRRVSDSSQFEMLPDALRQQVRQIIADAES